jgi:formamidopyrimidine-DNA glycosylase
MSVNDMSEKTIARLGREIELLRGVEKAARYALEWAIDEDDQVTAYTQLGQALAALDAYARGDEPCAACEQERDKKAGLPIKSLGHWHTCDDYGGG